MLDLLSARIIMVTFLAYGNGYFNRRAEIDFSRKKLLYSDLRRLSITLVIRNVGILIINRSI